MRAIGAPRRSLLSLILAESAGFAIAGSMVGVPMSRVVISQALGPDAAGLRSREIEWGAAAVLSLCSMLAALMPAWRAVQVDPIIALRYE